MNASKQMIFATAAMGILGLGGLVRTVSAKQPQSQVTIMPQHHSSTLVAEASDGDGETNDDAKEQQESVRLQPLAKITPQQAQQAAEAANGGRASSVNLENENGNLVYAVEIGQQEVKVDAGNGRVLYTEKGNQRENQNEASRLHSSIQVPQASNGNGEVNEAHDSPNDSDGGAKEDAN